ncbi:MAG: hypothetical protein IH605_07575, partial [Burkholderiales bacterium]|nr:hypothetical protein [Burkholderiales bacterium]
AGAVFLLGHRVEDWLYRVHNLKLGLAAVAGVLAAVGGGMLLVRIFRGRQQTRI